MFNERIKARCVLCLLMFFVCRNIRSTVYYVDSSGGNDSNAGTSVNSAWQNLSKINSFTFAAGDQLLLKNGGNWVGTLSPKGSGSSGNPILLSSYGTNLSLPLINGNGTTDAVLLTNQQYWEISNLEVVNPSSTDAERRGIHLCAGNFGQVNHLYVSNCFVHNIRGHVDTSNGDIVAKRTGGIIVEVTTDAGAATWFNDVIIQNCTLNSVTNQGIVACGNRSGQSDFPGTAAWNGRNCSNLIIRNNVISDVSKNAMIIRLADETCLVEHNLVYNTAKATDGNQIFTAACRGTVFQFNEGYLNSGSGAADGSLYDADLRSPLTVWQYSYSHDNTWGLFVDYTGDTDTNVVVRYNISQNDRGDIFAFSGNGTSIGTTCLYNNTIYSTNASVVLVDDRASGHTNYFYNNIFYLPNATNLYNFHTYNTAYFDHNLFYGVHPSDEPFDAHKLTLNPQLAAPGSGGGIGGTNNLTTLAGYKLLSNSPCIDSGISITTNLTGNSNVVLTDFFGVPVPTGSGVDRGASEWISVITNQLPTVSLTTPSVFPNRAVIKESINPGNAQTTYYAAYGLSTNYGSFTLTNFIPAGTNLVSVTNQISGLLSGSTYHYRVYVSNSVGATNSIDSVFTTSSVVLPRLTGTSLDSRTFKLSFTNTPSANFTVLTSTNLTLSRSNWTAVGVASEILPGQYSYTDFATNSPARFYQISCP